MKIIQFIIRIYTTLCFFVLAPVTIPVLVSRDMLFTNDSFIEIFKKIWGMR